MTIGLGIIIGLLLIAIGVAWGISIWKKRLQFLQLKKYFRVLDIAEKLKVRTNAILEENENILAPIFRDRQSMRDISKSMNNLFNIQKSRADFGEWKSFLETVIESEKSSEINAFAKDLIDLIAKLQNALYSYEESSIEQRNNQQHMQEITKKYLVNKIFTQEQENQFKKYGLEELRAIVTDYLNYLRSLTEKTGEIVGRIKGMSFGYSSNDEYKPTTNKSDETKNVILQIVTALISLFGTVVTAYFGLQGIKMQIELPLNATKTAEAQLTKSFIPTATPTSVINPILATNTPFLKATLSPSPSPTVVTITPIPEIIFQDDFLNNKNNWLTSNDSFVTIKILKGQYLHSINCPISYQAYYCGSYIYIPVDPQENFTLSFDYFLEDKDSDTDVMVSVQFRRSDKQFYSAFFSMNGNYQLKITQNSTTDTLFEGNNPIIHPGIGEINRFGISADSYKLTLFANGEKLGEIDDGNIAVPGQMYFAIFVSKGGKASIAIDNLIIAKAP